MYADLKDKVALVIGAGQSGDPRSTFWGNGAAIAQEHNALQLESAPAAGSVTQSRLMPLAARRFRAWSMS